MERWQAIFQRGRRVHLWAHAQVPRAERQRDLVPVGQRARRQHGRAEDFSGPQEQNFDAIASLIIVPKHIWASIKNPVTFADPHPVGTGPFELSSFSPQGYLLTKNPHYWQQGKPGIAGLRFVAYSDNSTQANAITEGQIDWAADYIPNAQQTYLSRSASNHYWVPEAGSDGLIPNLDTFPLSDLQVRKAISLGIDRQAIGAARNSQAAVNQTGLPVPSFDSIIAPQYQNASYQQDIAGAKQLLVADGWKLRLGRLLREERPRAVVLGVVPGGLHRYRRGGLGAGPAAQGDRHQDDDRHGPDQRDQHAHRAGPVPCPRWGTRSPMSRRRGRSTPSR